MNKQRNRIDTVFVLMIFCGFAMSVFLVLMLSGSTYMNMMDISREGQNERIVLSYIRTRIRSTDSAGSVAVSSFDGLPALSLVEVFGERVFVTKIYLYNGWVHELFHEQGRIFAPSDGVPIIRSGSLYFEEAGSGLIRISTDHGDLLMYTRSTSSAEVLLDG